MEEREKTLLPIGFETNSIKLVRQAVADA